MKRTVLFDATRLLSRADRSAPTGIDRVCLAYAERLLARREIEVLPVVARRDRLSAIDRRWFATTVAGLRQTWSGDTSGTMDEAEARLVAALGGARQLASIRSEPAEAGQKRTRRGLGQLLRLRPLPEVRGGMVYVNVGHTGLDRPRILRDLGDRGVDRVVMVHDLIPVSHPEFCRPGEAARHGARIRTVLRHASHVVVNSTATGNALTAFAQDVGLKVPPMLAAHLGVESVFLEPGRQAAPDPGYFVHVGTLEARKNLAFLLMVWRRLAEQMGPATPHLVLVGRHGWENEAVVDHLERSPWLQGLVHQIAELSDSALARLLRRASGLVAPSSAEGFDLPVAEALALGTPVLASDIPVHREVAGGARLIDPLDGPAWLEAIRAMGDRPPGSAPFVAPTWDRHFEQVWGHIGLEV
ncbi:glycosyltransferase [Rhizobium sp. CRIBSB]|nr:glycosyltransferase [Rhizobium sp. CRIBSB]